MRDKAKKAAYDQKRYQENRQTLLAQKREYYEANRERLKAAVKVRTDPEAKRLYDRKYNQRAEVRIKRQRQRKGWNQANPDRAQAHNRERSWVRRHSRPDLEARQYMSILFHDPCSYCGSPHEHVDHVQPLKHSGNSVWDNLTSSCQRCNYAKRDKSLIIFLHSAPLTG